MTTYAIACSHLPHSISGADLPIGKMATIIRSIGELGGVLFTSAGELHWNLQLCAAIIHGVPVNLVCSRESSFCSEESVRDAFPHLKILSFELVNSNNDRDSVVLNRADLIYSLWCRSGGNIATLLEKKGSKAIDYSNDCSSFRWKGFQKQLFSVNEKSIEEIPEAYLWHWTRSPFARWPDEQEEFYGIELLRSFENPRTALTTLQRIVESKVLLASSSMIAHSSPVVCFSANHPREMEHHFTWRSGRHRMNFEPYGIGFPREILAQRGVVPVQYGERDRWDSLCRSDRWKSEKEWRYLGDFDFSELIDEMIVVVAHPHEQKDFPARIVFSYQ